MKPINLRIIIFLLSVLILSSCGHGGEAPAGTSFQPDGSQDPTLTPFQPEGYIPPQSLQPSVEAANTSTPIQTSLWISPAIPEALRQATLTSGFYPAINPTSAEVKLDVASETEAGTINWIYALVTPFPTITDNISYENVQAAWRGLAPGPFTGKPLWMTASTLAAWSAIWGEPAAGAVAVAEANKLVESTWADQPAWAIIPFEELEPRWKVLSIDNQSPVSNEFNQETYPLKVNFILQPSVFPLPSTNRNPNKLTVLAMTGVTALVRGTADQMEQHGILYPGEEVRQVLRSADLTHVSNEVPFYEDCPTPDPWTSSLQFCSDPSYISLLEDVGVDIVELTGNHQMDYGSTALLATLDMYDQMGLFRFGGGRDLADALQPAKITNHGNKLAFLGCNPVGPASDWATAARPGSTPCDYPQMEALINVLRSEGYLPIVTLQYQEYYQPEPTDYEQSQFRELAEAGAVIVSGSQSHVPAAMEFDGQSFIHYGLGNLFFDQMSYELMNGTVIYDTRDVFIDRHIFYDGRYLGTELLTYRIEDYARPRLMNLDERGAFLQRIFSAAGW